MYQVMKPQIVNVETRTCDFHKKHPGRPFPGCTCSGSYSSRDKTFEEMTDDEIARYRAALKGEDVNGNSLF